MAARTRPHTLVNFFSAFSVLEACVSPSRPIREMIVASSAMKAAERSQAEKRSPDLYRRAENTYWRAKQFYLAKEFKDCRLSTIEARRLAELSELEAEIRAAKEGENK